MQSNEALSTLLEAVGQIKDICENLLTSLAHLKKQNTHQVQVRKFEPQFKQQQQFLPQSAQNDFFNDTQSEYKQAFKPIKPLINPNLKKSKANNRTKPKAPLTPYFLFFNRKRQYIRSKYPHLSQSQMANVAGQVWRALSPNEKQPYQVEYKQNKQEYAVKIKQFYENNPDQMPLKYRKRTLQNQNFDMDNPTENEQFNGAQRQLVEQYVDE